MAVLPEGAAVCGSLTIKMENHNKSQGKPNLIVRIQNKKGHIVNLVDSCSTDLFMETNKHITSYVSEKYSGDIWVTIKDLQPPTIKQPTLPPDTPITWAIFSEEIKEYIKHSAKLHDSVQQLWTLVWAQCSHSVCTHIEALTMYETM